jgi:uncharacterized protein (TIGR03437 family)
MLTTKSVRLFILLLTAVIFPAAAAVASVDFTPSIGSTATSACPGAIAAITYIQLQTSNGGTVDAGSYVIMTMTSGAVIATSTAPTVDAGAPSGFTVVATPGTSIIYLSFASNATLAAGSSIIVRGISVAMPTNVGSGVVVSGAFMATVPAGSANFITFPTSSTVYLAYVSSGNCTGHMTISPTSLTFGATSGSDPDPQMVTITDLTRPGVSLGLTAYASSQSPPVGWLNPQAVTEASGVATLVVTVSAKSLPEGSYTGVIQIISSLPVDNSPFALTVMLTVGKAGIIALSVTQFSFAAAPGVNPPDQTLTVTNLGKGTLAPYPRATMTGGIWLNVVGFPEGDGPYDFAVRISSASLAPGTYAGTIYIYSDQAYNSPQSIPVTLTIRSARPTIALSPSSLSFVSMAGQNPDPQTFKVSNSDIGTLAWQASSDSKWLTLSPSSGTAGATASTVTAKVNTAGLAAGTYAAAVSVASDTDAITNSPQTISVSLTLTSPPIPPTIAASPATLTFTADQATNPAAQSIRITNAGGGTLAWAASATMTGGGNWLSVTPASGGGGDSIQVTVTSASLAPSTYAGTITITSSSTGVTNSPLTIPVALTVSHVTPVITVNPASLSFVVLPNATTTPAPQTVSITNAGTGALNWSAVASTTTGGNWLLLLSSSSGTAPSTLAVSVDTSRLALGNYSGAITLASTGAPATAVTIGVALSYGAPTISPNGVVNAAHLQSVGLSPGGLITIFGTNFASTTKVAPPIPSLPDQLAGTSVKIGGFNARLAFVSPTQINAQAPFELTASTAQVTVAAAGMTSNAVTLPVMSFDPGLFTFSGVPGETVAALHSSDYSAVNTNSPAVRGSVILLFGTGFGPVTPSVSSGQPGGSGPTNQTTGGPTGTIVLIGGRQGQVLYSGLAAGLVGVYQVNVQVPVDAPPGDSVPIIVGIGGRGTNTATISVR